VDGNRRAKPTIRNNRCKRSGCVFIRINGEYRAKINRKLISIIRLYVVCLPYGTGERDAQDSGGET